MPVDYKAVEKELREFVTLFYGKNKNNEGLLKEIEATSQSCWEGDPIPELAKIGTYLGNGEDLILDLKTLEIAMEQKMVQAIGQEAMQDLSAQKALARTYFNAYPERAEVPAQPKGPYSKLLTSVLKENEQACGFTPTIAVYLGRLTEAAFLQEASQARHFKDLISPQHGEYTHRIQWYLVSQKNFVEKSKVATVYRLINMIPLLWDYLFDRNPAEPPIHAGKLDFRRPENLNGYLTQDDSIVDALPLLTSFLRARRAKRTGEIGKGFSQVYAARKMFKKKYENLTQQEKEKVDACVKTNLMVLNDD